MENFQISQSAFPRCVLGFHPLRHPLCTKASPRQKCLRKGHLRRVKLGTWPLLVGYPQHCWTAHNSPIFCWSTVSIDNSCFFHLMHGIYFGFLNCWWIWDIPLLHCCMSCNITDNKNLEDIQTQTYPKCQENTYIWLIKNMTKILNS